MFISLFLKPCKDSLNILKIIRQFYSVRYRQPFCQLCALKRNVLFTVYCILNRPFTSVLYTVYAFTIVYCIGILQVYCILYRHFTSVLYTVQVFYKCIVYCIGLLQVYCILYMPFTSVLYTVQAFYQCIVYCIGILPVYCIGLLNHGKYFIYLENHTCKYGNFLGKGLASYLGGTLK